MKSEKGFTIRVYGILLTNDQKLLITEEMYKGQFMRKFPGGGLQWGEGLHAALKREIMEETEMDVEIGRLWYINDNFIVSAFDPQTQLIAAYFEITAKAALKFPEVALNTQAEKAESYRLVPIEMLSDPTFFTFPADQEMGRLLYQHFRNA